MQILVILSFRSSYVSLACALVQMELRNYENALSLMPT